MDDIFDMGISDVDGVLTGSAGVSDSDEDAGGTGTSGNIDKAIHDFLEQVKFKTPSEHTCMSYATDLRQLAEYLKECEIDNVAAIDTTVLRGYLRELAGFGFSKASISRKLSSMRGFFGFLKSHKLIEKNPSSGLHGPKAPRRLPRAISEDAIEHIFDVAKLSNFPTRNTAILELLYGCGLRVSELVSLKWADVDIEDRWLVILGKGDKERRVPFGHHAQEALEQLRLQQLARDSITPFVFSGHRNGISALNSLTVRTVHRVVIAIAEKAGIEGVTPHVLRHSCATHLLEHGASLKFVQEFLGHESLATTQVYLTISASWMKKTYAAAYTRAED